MNGMKKITGHHWTTHSAVVILLFVVLGALFAVLRGGRGIEMGAGRLIGTVVSAVILATLIIVGFYLFVD
jgi:high-affinity nickel permease